VFWRHQLADVGHLHSDLSSADRTTEILIDRDHVRWIDLRWRRGDHPNEPGRGPPDHHTDDDGDQDIEQAYLGGVGDSDPFDNRGVGHAAALTHRLQSIAAAGSLEFIDQGG
jgi:hypothetical protein